MSFDIQRMFRRIQHLVRPGRLSANAVESGVIQRAQVRYNEIEINEINSMQQYGFASSLKRGCDVMIINVAGDNANGDVIASNDQRHRPRGMVAGEVRIYADGGAYVRVKGDEITIIAPTKVTVTSPEVTMSGKLTVEGDIVSTSGDVKAGAITLKTHRTSGVVSGGAISGPPVV